MDKQTFTPQNSRFIDIAGQRFVRLVAVAFAGRNSHGDAQWHCQCDCGGTVVTRLSYIRNGHTRSCGCLQKETRAERVRANTIHNQARMGLRTLTYNSWRAMRDRCLSPGHPAWPNYGGSGITVCDRWAVFENFLADMGERPRGHTIDRVDNDLGYAPGNCRWANLSEQALNRRLKIGVSGFRGVTPEKRGWSAKIYRDGKRYRLGVFLTPEDASAAYYRAADQWDSAKVLESAP